VPLLYGNLSQAANARRPSRHHDRDDDSDSTDFAKGIMAIRGDTRFDINVHDVGNAVRNVRFDKRPGPIVGLLTAAS
jgi:hypothetical protein